MNALITTNYQGFTFTFDENGWMNATEAAANFGRRPNDFLALASTKEYIEALEDDADTIAGKSRICDATLRNQKIRFLKVKRGGRGKPDTTWLHPDLVVPFARWINVHFAIWCDRQIKALLSGSHPHHDWKRMRHQAASSFKVMNQILQLTRTRLGKTCAPHHFSNEARLVNWALTGEFGKLDRDALSSGDLDLLAKLENLDAVLIGCAADYETRKRELEFFTSKERKALQITLEDAA